MKKVSLILILFLLIVSSFPNGVSAKPGGGVRDFHGKWVSVREGHSQTLKIRCDAETNYCKMRLVTQESETCTTSFGEPTDALLVGEGQVQTSDHTIEIIVDAYCLTKPPTYSFTFPVTFTYDEVEDTLTDNIKAVWHRK